MKAELLMGIDIGTTGCKTILVDREGTVVDSEIAGYPFYAPKHGWSEQDPEDWWPPRSKPSGASSPGMRTPGFAGSV